MKFKATSTIILYHENKMCVFNAGDEGELPEGVIQPYIDGGIAVAVKGKAAKAAKAPEPEPEPEAEEPAPTADTDAPPA
jgi:hypothetical protein